ncbi:MAG: hypothetical protein GY913_02160 [Proteobacteria bacterium]|nr:hypothetical protein [Pseudomonadota bacterium]MCP4915703.1 hypothetical protein [Pseudomonadota bacterium]
MLTLLLACSADVPTWHADVSPLLNEHCTRCHQDGGQGPGNYTTYDGAVSLAPFMLDAIDEGRMPPPTSEPECREFVGQDHMVLEDDEAAIVAAWIAAEMPEGDPDDAVEVIPPETELSDPDLVITIPEYTPSFSDPDNPGNEYRCFVLEHGQTEEVFVSRMGAMVDNTDLVHHVVLFAAEEEDIPEDTDDELGFDCINDAFIGGDSIGDFAGGGGMIGGWAPGQMPTEFDEGTGMRLNPDMKLILQLHYYDNGEEIGSDQSGWGFELTEDVHTPVLMVPMGVYGFRIPKNDDAYTETGGWAMPLDFTIHQVFPHMHVLGTSYRMQVSTEQGDICVVEGDYDFDNQLSYQLVDPVEVDAGDIWTMSCTWDNSDDNPNQINETSQPVKYGERTDEEMCFGFSLISLGN